MDSGNSGSMQSSSGGDEEYDSRAESISALLSTNPQSHVSHLANHHAPPHPHHHQQQSQSCLFDPLSNFFDQTALSSRSPIVHLDMVWPRTLGSDPNSTDLGPGLMPSSSPSASSSTQNQSHPFLTNSQLGQGQNRGGIGIGIGAGVGVGLSGSGFGVGVGSRNSFPGIQIPQENNASRGTNPVVVSGGSSAQNDRNDNNVVRNPKKRSRASRRAPTTVLTTDTTNFRAMVQEFTGIPAPPFTSSPFPRTTRLDLFGTGGAAGGGGGGSSMMRSGPLDSQPPYLLRPFPHKVQASQLQQTTSFVPPTTSSSTASLLSSSNLASTSTAINYQQPPPGGGGGGGGAGQNHLMMQNPVLNFHSLLQTQQTKFPLSKPQLGPLDHQISHGLEEFGLGHHGLGGLPNLMSSELPQRNDGNNPTTTTTTTTTTTGTTNWGEVGIGSNDNNNRSGNDNNNSNIDHHQHQQHQGLLMRSINGGTTSSNGKLNYSASSSDFHGGKGPENVTSRTEGMVESWICSSD